MWQFAEHELCRGLVLMTCENFGLTLRKLREMWFTPVSSSNQVELSWHSVRTEELTREGLTTQGGNHREMFWSIWVCVPGMSSTSRSYQYCSHAVLQGTVQSNIGKLICRSINNLMGLRVIVTSPIRNSISFQNSPLTVNGRFEGTCRFQFQG
jgi:hypothetical protein